MDAPGLPFPHPLPTAARGGLARDGRATADGDVPTRLHAWLTAVGARLRATLDGFPDAIWLASGSVAAIAECGEDGRWSIDDRAVPAAGPSVQRTALAPGVHEVPDVMDDASFDDYPTAARWPMARRLCRVVFEGASALDPGPVMMLVGSLPGRMSPAHRQALDDWIPAASALLAMILADAPAR